MFQGIYNSKADYIAYYCNVEKTDATINDLCEIALELEENNAVSFILTDDNKVAVYLGG